MRGKIKTTKNAIEKYNNNILSCYKYFCKTNTILRAVTRYYCLDSYEIIGHKFVNVYGLYRTKNGRVVRVISIRYTRSLHIYTHGT